MILFPHAKINLGLNVISRRSDGFHNIETLFYPVGLSDIIEFIIAPDGKMKFENSGIAIGNHENNLCIKAYHLLKSRFDLPPLHIHLHKLVPIGAGLGGGSSDAAFMLKGLNDFFGLKLGNNELERLAASLGSDCPFFIHNKPLFATGRGDQFSEVQLSLQNFYLVIVNPGIFISTSQAYQGIDPVKPQKSIPEIIQLPVDQWKGILENDFEKNVFSLHPAIKEIKEKLYREGALYASMSGSGSSVFGVFHNKPQKLDFDQHYFIWDGFL